MAVQPEEGQRFSVTLQAALAAAIAAVSFLIFESTKEFLFAQFFAGRTVTRWESHVYTIIFGALVTCVLALFIGRKRNRLYNQLLETAARNRETTERLALSEERYRLLLDSTGEGIFGVDMNGHCTFCNPAALRLLGYSDASEILGKDTHALLHHSRKDGTPYPAGECPAVKARVAGRGVHIDDEVYWRKDGTSFDVEYWCFPMLHDGRLIGKVTAFLDISARKRDEEVMRQLADIVESSQDAIISLSCDGTIRSWNAGAERVFGYLEAEVMGKPVAMLSSPEEQDEYRHVLEKIEAHQKVDQWETSRIRKDGQRIDISLTASPMTDASGKLTGVSAIIRDITERKSLQAQLLQAQKMDALGQVAGAVAHDFNNLLMVINGSAELLHDRIKSSRAAGGYLGQIKQATEQAAGLTRQLLAFSRKQKLQPRVLNLNEVIQGMGAMLPRVLRSDIEITTHLGTSLACVRADQTQIEQVILNLAVNARDAMPHGGRLTLETADVEFDEEYAHSHLGVHPGSYVMLAVSDTGTGMDEQTQARIFEPFFTTKPQGQGTGLGLATVHGIVKQSQGWIWVYSELGRGTTLKVYLPRVEGAPAAVPREKTTKRSLRGSETILVVEDQEGIRGLAAGVLQELGYKVLQAADGLAALHMAEKHKTGINLLLTDVIMPKMSGRELVNQLSALDPQLKVLMMSAYPESHSANESGQEKIDGFIQKPFSLRDLATKVREILDTTRPVAR